jgi:DNA-binding CsgD family transcriptional regulator
MQRLILFLLLFVLAVPVKAQIKSIGKPFIRNYQRSQYQAGQQNWMIAQSPGGRMYFANNNGLLEFDGFHWETYPLPNRTIVRSIYAAADGKIYAGGFNEFGYFEPDSMGRLDYRSLTDMLNPEDRDFGDVWRIHNTPDGMVFESFSQLILLVEDEIKVVKAPGAFHFSYFVNGQLILVDRQEGLLRYTMDHFFPLIGTERLTGREIWAILPFGNQLLIATSDKGIYLYDGNRLERWNNPAAEYLTKNQVFSALRLDDNTLAFGTIQNGVLICTNDGKPVQKINRQKGLQNNTILSMLKDSFGNLWLGTDNGIDYVEINSPLSLLSHEYGLSTGYTAVRHKGYLYLGTNQGVFYKKWVDFLSSENSEPFSMLSPTQGQVWTLQVIDDQLFCGHHKGAFLIDGTRVAQIGYEPGCWTFLPLEDSENTILAGTYSGLISFRKRGNSWTFQRKITGFDESSRSLILDDKDRLWIGHGFKGIFRLSLSTDIDSVLAVWFYDADDGFNTNFGIKVHRINNTILFTSSEGIFSYDETNDVFQRNDRLMAALPLTDIRNLAGDDKGNIWYFAGNDAGVMRIQEDGSYADIKIPFTQLSGNFVGGFEFVYPIDNTNVLFGTGNGFFHYNPGIEKDYQRPFSVFLNTVGIHRPDSIVFSGHTSQKKAESPVLKYSNNAVYFDYAANNYENLSRIEFSTFLEGYDDAWSIWETRNNRAFTNLREGNYNFAVKARNIYGKETETLYYTFSINPPWGRTTLAYFIYAIGFILLVLLVFIVVRKRIERSKKLEKQRQLEKFREREEKMQREALEAEKEIIRLRNEKLREEMVMKDKELANSTLDMIQKNKLFTRIKNDLKTISQQSGNPELKDKIAHLTKKINKELDTEKQWEVFESHFESVHEAFLKRLKTNFPDLSPRELKLCAYLRLNISSKEIAVLMNISTRGVEISRYRLRKKLHLSRNENLTEFILGF